MGTWTWVLLHTIVHCSERHLISKLADLCQAHSAYRTDKFGPHSKSGHKFSWRMCNLYTCLMSTPLSLGTSSFFLASPASEPLIHSRTWEKYQLAAFCILTKLPPIPYNILRQGVKWSNINLFTTFCPFWSFVEWKYQNCAFVPTKPRETCENMKTWKEKCWLFLLIFNLVEPTQRYLHSGYLSGPK